MNTKFSILLVALAQGLTGLAQAADDEGLKFSWSGFGQFTAAKVLSGKTGSYQQWQCPCALQNWEYVGAYEKAKGWQADQESLLGLQGTVRVNDRLSGTVQLLSRPNNDNYRPSVDWAYVTYALSDEWTLQAGRKRIPLFYYSDFLYVGTVYPWVRPTPNVYGWPIYAYDGANLAYSTSVMGNWTLDANAWAGNFSYKNNPNITKIYYTDPTDEKWRNILGAYATLSNGDRPLPTPPHMTRPPFPSAAPGSKFLSESSLRTPSFNIDLS